MPGAEDTQSDCKEKLRARTVPMLADDPFNQVRTQVVSMLKTAERQHTKWGEARRRKPVRHDECAPSSLSRPAFTC